MRAGLIAIAKDENRFILEWAAHYLALGFERIVVYDHDSTDGMSETLDALSRAAPVARVPWRVPAHQSPQACAYDDAIARFGPKFEWLAFFDIDEFLVFRHADLTLASWLDVIPRDAGAVGVNWLTFGSGGRIDNDYGLVRDTFRTGGVRDWGNNRHIKSIVRPEAVRRMRTHHAELKFGAYLTPSRQPLEMTELAGKAERIDHTLMQVNHYQTKSRADFAAKMARGRASKRAIDPLRFRPDPEDFFTRLDRNEVRYDEIDLHHEAFAARYGELARALARPAA